MKSDISVETVLKKLINLVIKADAEILPLLTTNSINAKPIEQAASLIGSAQSIIKNLIQNPEKETLNLLLNNIQVLLNQSLRKKSITDLKAAKILLNEVERQIQITSYIT